MKRVQFCRTVAAILAGCVILTQNLSPNVLNVQAAENAAVTASTVSKARSSDLVRVFRIYNPFSGDHLFTSSKEEKDFLIANGWRDEGTAWSAPASSKTPVYRLYNSVTGENRYTADAKEQAQLIQSGWTDAGIAWYSDDKKGVPVYGLLNPALPAYNIIYTSSQAEYQQLLLSGWQDLGVAWYAAKKAVKKTPAVTVVDQSSDSESTSHDDDGEDEETQEVSRNTDNTAEEEDTSEETTSEESDAGESTSETEETDAGDTTEAESGEIDMTDTDQDGVPDGAEEEFGSDPTLDDTDGDGLDDYQEDFILGTDPTRTDTDGDGVSDADEDADGDGISNLNEIQNGTNPRAADSDDDGLSDSEEGSHGTDPLNPDCDGDGALDGWEVSSGYNPLSADGSFETSVSASSDGMTASVTADLNGAAADQLEVAEAETSLITPDCAGYMGPAFDFTLGEGEIQGAEITFRFDASYLDSHPDCDPTIYYYNPDTQLLEELETTVEGNTARAEVTHFSTYVLIDKTAREEEAFQELELKASEDSSGISTVFVIDRSESMNDNDPDGVRKDLTVQIIEKLLENDNSSDKVSVIAFIRTADVLTELSNDFQTAIDKVNDIQNDDGLGSHSGTNGTNAIHEALEQLEADTSDNDKYIIFMTDGQDTHRSYSYDELAEEAKSSQIIIYTIGLGDVNSDVLSSIAEQTGGKYYYASEADELTDIYEDVQNETVDLYTDSNDDGISDYYTQKMVDGGLRTGTGGRIFPGASYDEIQSSDDYDGDGVRNGDEVQVKTIDETHAYVKYVSDPASADSDDDGIDDKEDTAPLKKGLKNGIIGKLTLVSCYNEESNDWQRWFGGHVFFAYESYVRDTQDYSGLTAGWSRKDRSSAWSWENLQEDYPAGSYVYAPGETATIGNGGFGLGWFGFGDSSGSSGYESTNSGAGKENGVCYNMEIYKVLSPEYQYNYLHNTSISMEVTEEDMQTIVQYCSQSTVNYWSVLHNCAEVACHAWNLVSDTRVDPYTDQFLEGIAATPTGLMMNLRTLHGHVEDYSLVDAIS